MRLKIIKYNAQENPKLAQSQRTGFLGTLGEAKKMAFMAFLRLEKMTFKTEAKTATDRLNVGILGEAKIKGFKFFLVVLAVFHAQTEARILLTDY